MSNRLVLALDLGGSKIAAAAVTRRGKIVRRAVEPVDLSSTLAPIAQIKRLAQQLAGKSDAAKVFGAGAVAVPGLVRRNGTVWAPNLPGWKRVPLRARLQSSLGIPFVVESDRNAAALGEAWLGAAKGKLDAVLLIVGTGIGAGILSGGCLVRGAHELSGCAGWMVVSSDYPDEARRCGQLEFFGAGPALSRAAPKRLAKLSGPQLAQAARAGDIHARRIFQDLGKFLGRGVANIVSLFDPEVVIIGGGIAESSDLFLLDLLESVRQFAQPLAARQVKIRVSRLRGDANLLGAAKLAWEEISR